MHATYGIHGLRRAEGIPLRGDHMHVHGKVTSNLQLTI